MTEVRIETKGCSCVWRESESEKIRLEKLLHHPPSPSDQRKRTHSVYAMRFRFLPPSVKCYILSILSKAGV
jgi:hypothetical protein